MHLKMSSAKTAAILFRTQCVNLHTVDPGGAVTGAPRPPIYTAGMPRNTLVAEAASSHHPSPASRIDAG